MKGSVALTYFLSFLLAFCSLSYEFIFAHILSICIGGTKFQYLLTISIFTFALGIGSILFNFLKRRYSPGLILFITEILLTLLGSSGPFFITWLLNIRHFETVDYSILKILSYSIIFLVGLLSGLEVPCLFTYSENKHGQILSFDYLGMLVASLFFPLIGLPILGSAGTGLFVSNLNLFAIMLIYPFSKASWRWISLVIILSTNGVIFYYLDWLNELLSRIYLLGT